MRSNCDKSSGARMLRAIAIFISISVVMGHADAKLNELKKRKVDLEDLARKCESMDEPDRSECLAKRQKKVNKYKSDLEKYKAGVMKEEANRASAPSRAPSDVNSQIGEREKSIRGFQDYINSCTEKTDRCASALFQVANLTFQNEEDAFIVKQTKFEQEYQKWEDRDGKGPEPIGPRRNHENSLRLFERFLKEYANHRDAPVSLVRSAFIADMQGNDDRSYEYLNLMVTRFPDHPLNVQAHLRLGEYWLLKRKYAKAIEHYVKVPVNYPGAEAALALYHRAEAYYNMADFETAARYYFDYVNLADKGKLKADLREEAMQFMAASWADLDNGFEVAEKFLRSKGNPKWEEDIYYEIGIKNKSHDRLDEAVKAFQFLLRRNPTYAKAPIADLNIVEIFVIQKRAEDAQQARMELVQRYASNSNWSQANSSNKKAFEEAQKAIKIAMYQIPVYYHTKGEEGQGNLDMLGKAEQHYKSYLDRYSSEDSWDIYQVHQNLAVVYQKMKQFAKSADEWMWCAAAPVEKYGKLPPEKKDIVSKQDASYNSVIMMDENRKQALDRAKGDKSVVYGMPETQQYFSAVKKYMATYGKSNSAPDIAYNAAFVHYEAKQFKKAIESLQELDGQFPKHQHSNLIKRALAQSLLEDGQFEAAEKQFSQLLNKLSQSDKQYQDVRKSLASTIFKQADVKASNKDHSGAGLKYLQMARDFRDVDIADKALFEAGLNYDSAGRTEEGVRVLLRIHQEYPKSELRIKSILRAASMYLEKKQFRGAAETFLLVQRNFPQDSMGFLSIGWAAEAYEKVPNPSLAGATYESSHRLYPKEIKTPSFLYNAGQIYENGKEFQKAIRVYKILGENYPSSQFAIEALFSVPLIMEKKGDFAQAANSYETFVKQYENDKNKLIRAHLGAGKNYEKLGDSKKALHHYSAVSSIQDKFGEKALIPPAIAAEAGYHAGNIYFQQIIRVRLNGTKAQNKAKYKEMQNDLAPAITHFAKSASMAEEEWTLRSTLRMGDLFATMAKIADEEKIHAKGLEEQIAERVQIKASLPGYLDKAKELYQKNLDLAKNQVIESPWIDSSGYRFVHMYWQKGQAFEEVGRILASAPIPKGLTPEEKELYQEALKDKAYEASQQAIPIYKEALRAAAFFSIENQSKQNIASRLRELNPESEELNLRPEPKPQRVAGRDGAPGMPASEFRDARYESNMKRIAKIYENNSLDSEQKIELLLQMETEAKREINELKQEVEGASLSP